MAIQLDALREGRLADGFNFISVSTVVVASVDFAANDCKIAS